ncbi:hypothetical protein BZZ01_24790 [Nostocales cyanobacterium HT-58-2]|nr:hypothetical protein BZZ01_24790 [Nostocales cyanobacterium HT-58-2]
MNQNLVSSLKLSKVVHNSFEGVIQMSNIKILNLNTADWHDYPESVSFLQQITDKELNKIVGGDYKVYSPYYTVYKTLDYAKKYLDKSLPDFDYYKYDYYKH